MEAQEQNQPILHSLHAALDKGSMADVQQLIGSLQPGEVARLLESLPPQERTIVWDLVEPADEGDILVDVGEEVRAGLIEDMPAAELIAATEGMELDDLADLIGDLPKTVTPQILLSLDQHDQERLRQVLEYDEDSAGGLMNVDIVTVRPDVSLDVVLRYLRAHAEMPDKTDSIFVVNRNNEYVGSLYVSRLLTRPSALSVADIMSTDIAPILATSSSEEVVREFENRDLLSAPVVDASNRLLGRITVDDVVDVIRDQADHSLMSAVGLDEESDLFAPVVISARRRAIWLGVNLATAFLAAFVVDQFKATIDQVVLLAVLMGVVTSMGGVAGTQSLTIITRAMALGHIHPSNARRILTKEVLVGVLNGAMWAVLVGLFTMLWLNTWLLGAVFGAALGINLVIAALAGFSVPLILKRLNIDPAIAGGVVLTTITDVVGYFVFLSLGAAFLL